MGNLQKLGNGTPIAIVHLNQDRGLDNTESSPQLCLCQMFFGTTIGIGQWTTPISNTCSKVLDDLIIFRRFVEISQSKQNTMFRIFCQISPIFQWKNGEFRTAQARTLRFAGHQGFGRRCQGERREIRGVSRGKWMVKLSGNHANSWEIYDGRIF